MRYLTRKKLEYLENILLGCNTMQFRVWYFKTYITTFREGK
jgi:hypothetical protein